MSAPKSARPTLTLLQQAKQLPQSGRPGEIASDKSIQEGELLIAWVLGQVGSHAAATVLGTSRGGVSNKVGPMLRSLARAGRLTLALKEPS